MGYTVAWLLWLAAFLVIEGKALVDKKPGGTLSEHVWNWFDVRGANKRWGYKRFVLAAFMVWLSAHFIFGMFA